MEDVGPHGTCHKQSGRGAQPPADGNVGINVDFDTPHRHVQGAEHGAVGHIHQIVRPGEFLRTAGDLQTAVGFFKGHVGIKPQSAAEGIKAGA